MSTSENGSQLTSNLQESFDHDKDSNGEISSSHENIIPNGENGENGSDTATSTPPSPLASQNGSNLTLQSENLPPDSSLNSSDPHSLSQVTLDGAPEIHPTQATPSSEIHSQDSQYELAMGKNGKELQVVAS